MANPNPGDNINIDYGVGESTASGIAGLSDLLLTWHYYEPVTTLSVIGHSYYSLNYTETTIDKLATDLTVEGNRLKDICGAFIDYDKLFATISGNNKFGSVDAYKNYSSSVANCDQWLANE